jgi:glycosyltransferase involved in cell wall biosynthesis
MKVAVLASFSGSLIGFRGQLLAKLAASGHEVIASAGEADDGISIAFSKIGVRYVPLLLQRRGLNPFSDLFYLYKIVRFLRRESIEICLFCNIKPVIFGSIAARLARVKNVYSLIPGLGYAFIAKTPIARCVTTITTRLYSIALRRNCSVFFQNPDDRDLFVTLGLVKPNQAVLINGSGVDLQWYTPVPLPAGPMVFLMVARLLRAKGIIEYCQAAEQVKANHPNCVFRLVGPVEAGPDGLSRDDLEAWIQPGIVEYVGPVDDVRPQIREASVYVLPSYREGTPRSVLEAMACGRPIVTTDVPGCRETVVEGFNGFLVPSRDATKLAETCLRFVKEPELAETLGRNSRRLAEERFDVHRVNEVIITTMGLAHPKPCPTKREDAMTLCDTPTTLAAPNSP